MTLLMAALGFAALIVGTALTYLLIPEPFGPAFTAGFGLAVAGLLTLLTATTIALLRAPRRGVRACSAIPIAMAAALALVTGAVMFDARVIFFRGLPPHPTAEEWQEDLDFLATRMAELHPDLFSRVPRARFDSVVRATRDAIPAMSDEQVLMALFRIVALPNDAHTYPFIFDPVYDLHLYPLQAYWFDDGPYVVRAGRGYRRSVGSRIVAVAGVPIEELFQRFGPYISAENEFGALDRWSGIPFAEWLAAEGLGPTDRIIVTLEHPDRGVYDVSARPIHLAAFGYWAYVRRIESTSSPAVSNDRRKAFRFEHDEERQAVYFDFNQSQREWAGDTLAAILAELDTFLESHQCDRFILDLRNNGGGDIRAALDVVDFISGDARIDRRGALFVLIGRRTFSAGVVAASLMREATSAVLVGEPTGQGPAFFAGPSIITLPNSRLPVAVSTRRTVGTLKAHPGDRVDPDLRVKYTHDDFFAGRDPARAAALSYQVPLGNTTELAPAVLERLVGRYRYSPHQVAEVGIDGGRLILSVQDFLPTSGVRFRTVLYPTATSTFATHIPGMRVRFDHRGLRGSAVHIEWEGSERTAPRLPEDYRFPLERLRDGFVDAAVERVLADSLYYAEEVPGLEPHLNRVGYEHLRAGRTADAIAVFRLNVALFPRSSNAYDSLGEGYMEHGDTTLAIANYRRSLLINPDNANAREMLSRMGSGD